MEGQIARGYDVSSCSYLLGSFYLKGGGGVAADPAKARVYLDQAIATGYTYATVVLGRALLHGEGLPADAKAGLALLQKSIDSKTDVASAAFEIGTFYLTGGSGRKADPKKARAYLGQAMAAGYDYAGVILGRALLLGDGLPADRPAGLKMLEQEAAAGNSQGSAAFELGAYYLHGEHADAVKARTYLDQAVAAGHPFAPILLGRALLRGDGLPRDVLAGVQILQLPAVSSGPYANDAALDLANLFQIGLGDIAPDLKKARFYFHVAADRGAPEALASLADLELTASDGTERGSTAIDLYRRAVAAGAADAVVPLAHVYLEGQGGVPLDIPAGLKILDDAADAGNASALAELISLNLHGLGTAVPADLKQARHYLDEYKKVADPDDLSLQTLLVAAAGSSAPDTLHRLPDLLLELPKYLRPLGARELVDLNARAAVYVVQSILSSSGLYSGILDGLLGPMTSAAVKRACDQGKLGSCGAQPADVQTVGFIVANFT